jgi:hypothetical protein
MSQDEFLSLASPESVGTISVSRLMLVLDKPCTGKSENECAVSGVRSHSSHTLYSRRFPICWFIQDFQCMSVVFPTEILRPTSSFICPQGVALKHPYTNTWALAINSHKMGMQHLSSLFSISPIWNLSHLRLGFKSATQSNPFTG